MRSLRHAACILVAAGSIALAAWQPAVAIDRPDAEAAAPADVTRPVDESVPAKVDRAVLVAPIVKA